MATINIDKHLLLRTYTTNDHTALFEAIDNSRQHLNPWLNWVAGTTRPEHSLEFIENAANQLREQKALALGIFYNGQVIGGIGMQEWSHNTKRAQIGYWICAGYEGRGIINKALTAFITYLFDKAGLNKIEIHYVASNTRSGNVAKKLGFRLEGVIRQAVLRNGTLEDLIITGMLKTEWSNNSD